MRKDNRCRLNRGEIPIAGPVRLQVRKTLVMTLNPAGGS